MEIIIPITTNIRVKISLGKKLVFFKIMLNELGNKSVSDTHIITPAAKDKLIVTILLFFLLSKNIIKAPIKVDIPAKKDSKKAYKVLLGIYHTSHKLYAFLL
jgi:hypothetical protein